MRRIRSLLAFVIIALLAAACAPATTAPQETVTLKIAVLPIIDTLPMYVAQQEGLFAKHGVNVEFVPVASAPERDQLVGAGQADGMVNETISVMLFNKEKVQVQAVRYALRPTENAGHFFIIASAKSGITDAQGLKGIEIGVSQGTIIEYVTERLLQAEGLTSDEIKTIAVPKIPDRMALLASGELNAGVLPDPLGALAVQQGAVIVLDDSRHPEYGFSVISFRKEVIDANPAAIKAFLAAIEEATTMLNSDSKKYTSVLSDQKLVPPPLLASYAVPPFPTAGVPTEAEWSDALAWVKEKGMLTTDVSYADSVNATFLP
ncbi:MAG TPA: MetQ/NlpA family ABC transporter substrate-binding protein [Anaerolineales bacterium]|nr:MetQ/NlpA family ABC transporter substrate-binding protein [Anaerolineales bacterium]HMX19459.1 MetQ/NlpA family ABC transporter substrate-binding protein [Anaerolineales bacterium]HMX73896.1 MetQ/NlpA family ABC transporter substrate-binding protein [Anaerolineales bacterium]HMZ41906.1 MetQ/NlpA family ABC transporter substrate-binding protein [Anaerolineales bacterium]HNA53927.1 MetQ/NlpA family ABC transporter substrate-binding protein [Anaerolineales bacterium]